MVVVVVVVIIVVVVVVAVVVIVALVVVVLHRPHLHSGYVVSLYNFWVAELNHTAAWPALSSAGSLITAVTTNAAKCIAKAAM